MGICMALRITEIKHIHHQCIRIFCLIVITERRHLSLIEMEHFIFQSLPPVTIKLDYSPYRAASCAHLKFRGTLVHYTENVFEISVHLLVIIPDLHDHKLLLPLNLFPAGIDKNNLCHKLIQARRKTTEINICSLPGHYFSLQDSRTVLHQRIFQWYIRQRTITSSRIRDPEGNTGGLIAQELTGAIVLTCQTERTVSVILQFNT